MIRLIWVTSVHTRYFLRRYMPTNRLLDAIRTRRRGLKWGAPAMLLAVSYLLVANVCVQLIEDGGPGWLHLVVLWAIWIMLKMLWIGPISLVLLIRARVRAASLDEQVGLAERKGGRHELLTVKRHVDLLVHPSQGILGDVTPGSVYAHIDQSLGSWAQRPVFKTNVKKFVSLRETNAPIKLVNLQKLTVLFEEPTTQLQLDPGSGPCQERGLCGVAVVGEGEPGSPGRCASHVARRDGVKGVRA